jgi:hypothetical protein
MTTALMDKIGQKVFLPDADMRRFVEVLLNDTEVAGRPYRAEKKSGVQRQRFYYLLQTSPEFKQWFLEKCQLRQDARTAMVDDALFFATQQMDASAMRTFYELQGRLKQQNGKNGNGHTVNIETLIIERPMKEAEVVDVTLETNGKGEIDI